MREIPKKNYLLLGVLFIATIGLLIYLGAWYKQATMYDKNKSIIPSVVMEISEQEFGNYVLENPNTLLYVSSPTDETIKSYEKDLNKIIKSNDLINETVYIDLDKNPNLNLSKYYTVTIKNTPKEKNNLYVISDSKIVDYLARNPKNYTKELTLELLEKNGVINNNE